MIGQYLSKWLLKIQTIRWKGTGYKLFWSDFDIPWITTINSRPWTFFPQTNALGENLPSRYLNMFNLHLCNAATIRYSILKFGHMHLCGKGYKYFSPHCCKCNSFGCITAIRCGNTCHGPHSDSVYSGSEHRQFNSQRLFKREAGFPCPKRALIGSYQLWRVNDSPYYREYEFHGWVLATPCHAMVIPLNHCDLVMPYDNKDLGQYWLR